MSEDTKRNNEVVSDEALKQIIGKLYDHFIQVNIEYANNKTEYTEGRSMGCYYQMNTSKNCLECADIDKRDFGIMEELETTESYIWKEGHYDKRVRK